MAAAAGWNPPAEDFMEHAGNWQNHTFGNGGAAELYGAPGAPKRRSGATYSKMSSLSSS